MHDLGKCSSLFPSRMMSDEQKSLMRSGPADDDVVVEGNVKCDEDGAVANTCYLTYTHIHIYIYTYI
jgi:hypothetical protein